MLKYIIILGREYRTVKFAAYFPPGIFFTNSGLGSPSGSGVKSLPANAGDTGPIPGPGRSHMPGSS